MDKNINRLIKRVGQDFKNTNLSLVTAESCTGGGLSFYISKNPECSAILERGFVTYSNPSKEKLLNVKAETLQLKGAVSKEVAIEMATGALENSQAQVSIAITGIAGSDKRSANKNGIVWICCADISGKKLLSTKKITGGRNVFIKTVIYEAIRLLEKYINTFQKKKHRQ